MLVLEHRLYFIFILVLIQIGYTQISGTVSIDPTTACVGDSVTISCTLDVPNIANDAFFSILTGFIVGNSDAAVNEAAVDLTGTQGGVDLSKLMATAIAGSSTSVMGSITLLSYTTGDNGTRLGCANEYFINGDTSNRATATVNTTVLQATPPTAVSLSVSLTSLNASTCSGVVRVSWTPGATDRPILSYSLSLNRDTLGTFSPSVTSNDSSLSVATDTVYRYSVTASSCAGTSIPSYGVNISVQSYSLVSSPLYLSYDQSTSMLTVDWGLVPGNEPLLLGYSLQLNYSHSQYGTTNEFANSTYFSLISGTSLYSVPLTPHSFPTADGVVTNITACIAIASQCGTAFSGDMLCGFFNSEATQPPQTTQPAEALPVGVIAGAVGGGAVILFILIIVLVVVMLCICCGKKSKEHSPTVPKQPVHIYDEINEAPPAHYDYIEIDTLASKNTSTHKPPLDKLKPGDTHTYTHMNPVTSDEMVLQSPYENLPPS